MPTFEEVSRCPKCDKPGKETRTLPPPRGTVGKLVEFRCVSELCPWFDTLWMVQVNPDGSIPDPTDHRGKPKMFIKNKADDEMADRVREAIDLQIQAERSGSGEIRNPYTR